MAVEEGGLCEHGVRKKEKVSLTSGFVYVGKLLSEREKPVYVCV